MCRALVEGVSIVEDLTCYILSELGVTVIPLPEVPSTEWADRVVRTVVACHGVLVWDDGSDATM